MVNTADLITEGRGHLTDEGAAVLRDARRRRAMTVRGVAAASGLSPAYVSRLERGQRAPRHGAAVALIRALHIAPDRAEVLLREVAS